MNIEEAIKTIKSGRFFSAEFTKKDGSQRRIVGRVGVKKYLTGRGMSWNPSNKGYIPVYDLEKSEYRMLNTKTLTKVNNNDIK